jgi:hypothetical protein
MVGGEGGSAWVPWAVLGSDGLRFDRFTVGESLTSHLTLSSIRILISHLTAQDVDVDFFVSQSGHDPDNHNPPALIKFRNKDC